MRRERRLVRLFPFSCLTGRLVSANWRPRVCVCARAERGAHGVQFGAAIGSFI